MERRSLEEDGTNTYENKMAAACDDERTKVWGYHGTL